MENSKTDFFKEREFGDFISTPITFLVQEFKLICIGLLVFVAPFVLLETILSHYYIKDLQTDIWAMMRNGGAYPYNMYNGFFWLSLLVQLTKTSMLLAFISLYVKLYISSGKGGFTMSDIWEGIKKYFIKVFLANLLAWIMIIAGFILIVFPGIYIAVVMWIVIPVLIFEDETIGNTISRCFSVMKGNWWTTFGVFIVMYIMIIILSLIIGLIIGGLFGLFGTGALISPLTSIVSGIIQLIISAVLAITAVLLYTSFTDKKEKPELQDRIEQIAQEETAPNVFDTVEEGKKSDTDSENEENNRFLDDDENNRFKPKDF
jgi:hypothetical protein